ncbi:zinc ribbon domain-containing protein [bacterium]|nr:zinc ribbon domain-containing protein [bacterium]
MPIYEYQCADCNKVFEVLHGINEKPELHCESCGGSKVTRVMSAGAFVFKGSGFYATDYKNKSNGSSCSTCSESGSCPSAGAKS